MPKPNDTGWVGPEFPEFKPGGFFPNTKSVNRKTNRHSEFVPDIVPPPNLPDFVPTPVTAIPEVPVPPRPAMTGRQLEHARALIAESQRRSIEALKLYEPLPSQLKFHTSMSRQRISRGGNRSGKTTVTCAELAMAVTGQHWQKDKYPATDGLAIVVAKDLDKVGEVIWRKLGRAGAFQIVKDRETGLWRAYRPSTDLGMKTKPAPPLIPPRMIKDIAWESKKSNIPKKVILHNGWEISFYSSKSDPFSIQGTKLHCLSGWSEVFDPVAGRMRRIDEITEDFHVLSWDAEAGRIEVCPASKPFVKGVGEIVRVGLSNGDTIFTTRGHQVLAEDGQWVTIQDAFDRAVPLKSGAHTASEFLAVGVPAGRLPGMFRMPLPTGSCLAPRTNERLLRKGDSLTPSPWISGDCAGGRDRLGISEVPGFRSSCSVCPRPCGGPPLSGEGISPHDPPSRGGGVPRSPAGSRSGGPAYGSSGIRPRHTWAALATEIFAAFFLTFVRRFLPSSWRHGLGTTRFSSLSPPVRSSSVSRSRVREVPSRREIVSSRSLPAFGSEFRRLRANGGVFCTPSCTRRSSSLRPVDPRRSSGTVHLFPVTAEPHDRQSSATPTSLACRSLPEEIDSIHVTELESEGQSFIWDIYVPNTNNYIYGGTVSHNCVLFDEEIVHRDWYPEAWARLVDNEGWFMWSATPQTGTQQLYDLHLRAEGWAEEVEIDPSKADETPPVAECFMSIWDNPFIPTKAKNEFVDALDDDERRVRVDGEFAITGFKVYEAYFFPRGVHSVDPFPVPADWTRFAFIDPGAQVGAVLFAAIPPSRPEASQGLDPSLYGDFVYLYDEIYLRQCDARKLAARMKLKIGEGVTIQDFIIDHHGGRLTEIGSGKTPEQQYREAFKAEKVVSLKSGSSFTYGSDDLDGGILRVKDFLRVRDDGTAKIRVIRGACPNLVSEMERYQWKVVNGEVTEKPLKKRDHLVDCLRYCCMYSGLRYVKPKPRASRTGSSYEAFKALQAADKKRKIAEKGSGVTLG